ncbi:hypothetical protein Tco_1439755 [Tanacetum coccineum]
MEQERDDWRHTASDQVSEIEKVALEAGLTQAKADRQKLVREFILTVVADSYLLSMVDLMKVSPDAPTPPPPVNEARTSNIDGTDVAAQRSLPPI